MPISVALNLWGPRVRAQVQNFAARWPTFSWGTYPGHDPNEKLATDGMVPRWQSLLGRKAGQAVADAIWADRRKNGVWYLIFFGKIISTTYPGAGWRPYFARNDPNPSKSHKNHVHVSWKSDKAAGDAPNDPVSSEHPAAPAKPKPYTNGWQPELPWVFYIDKQADGVTESESVWLLQKALGLKPYDGTYHADVMRPLVSKLQRGWGNSTANCDGVLGPRDAAKLFGRHVGVERSSK